MHSVRIAILVAHTRGTTREAILAKGAGSRATGMGPRGNIDDLVVQALGGRTQALRRLVEMLLPVVQYRVARALLRGRAGAKQRRDLRQDVEDLTQEVLVALFEDNARALRSWNGTRGLSLLNFVGLVAEHQVASILRSGRRNPWTEEPMPAENLERAAGDAERGLSRVCSREILVKLLDRLRAELPPRSLELFHLLWVEERDAAEVAEAMSLSLDAVYAWRSRLGKLSRRLLAELEAHPGPSEGPPGPPAP